jgi:predicted HTH transcriptional regulator
MTINESTSSLLVTKTATRSRQSALDIKALKDLIRNGETELLEFKQKATHPEKIIREVVAFANTRGGILLVGVGDDRSIPGLKFADEDEYILVRAIEKLIVPTIDYSMERIFVGNEREVLLIRIEKSPEKPHFAIIDPQKDTRKAYVRIADRSVQASKEVRQILKWENKARNVSFKYGLKEEVLMKYLGQHDSVTLVDYAELANIPLWLASKTLITMVLASIIKIIPDEIADKYASIA